METCFLCHVVLVRLSLMVLLVILRPLSAWTYTSNSNNMDRTLVTKGYFSPSVTNSEEITAITDLPKDLFTIPGTSTDLWEFSPSTGSDIHHRVRHSDATDIPRLSEDKLASEQNMHPSTDSTNWTSEETHGLSTEQMSSTFVVSTEPTIQWKDQTILTPEHIPEAYRGLPAELRAVTQTKRSVDLGSLSATEARLSQDSIDTERSLRKDRSNDESTVGLRRNQLTERSTVGLVEGQSPDRGTLHPLQNQPTERGSLALKEDHSTERGSVDLIEDHSTDRSTVGLIEDLSTDRSTSGLRQNQSKDQSTVVLREDLSTDRSTSGLRQNQSKDQSTVVLREDLSTDRSTSGLRQNQSKDQSTVVLREDQSTDRSTMGQDSSNNRGTVSQDSSTDRGTVGLGEDQSTDRSTMGQDSSNNRGTVSQDSSTDRGTVGLGEDQSTDRSTMGQDSSTERGTVSQDSSTDRGTVSQDSSTDRGTVGLGEDQSTDRSTMGQDSSTDRGTVSQDSSTDRGTVSQDSSTDRGTVGLGEELLTDRGTVGLREDQSTDRGTVGLREDQSTDRGTVGQDSSTDLGTSTVSRAGERTLLSVTFNSTSMYPEDSNSSSQASNWGSPAGHTGPRDITDSISSTELDNTDATSDSHNPTDTISSKGRQPSETQWPGTFSSRGTHPLTGPPNVTEQRDLTSLGSEGTPSSTPPLSRYRDRDTTDSSQPPRGRTSQTEDGVSASSQTPVMLSGGPSRHSTNASQEGDREVTSIMVTGLGTTDSPTGPLSTRGDQGETEGVPSVNTEDITSLGPGPTTGSPTLGDRATALDDSPSRFLSGQPPFIPKTEQPAVATEVLESTVPITVMMTSQVTEDETNRVTTATSTTPTPPPATTRMVQPSTTTIIEARTPPTSIPATTTSYTTLGLQTSTSTPQRPGTPQTHTQGPSTWVSSTDVTTLHLETSTATPGNNTAHSGQGPTSTTTASSTTQSATFRGTVEQHSLGKPTDRGTTVIQVTTTPMDIRPTQQMPGSACEPNHCLNGGVCAAKGGTASCSCLPAWTGPTCNKDVDECESGPGTSGPCPSNSKCKNIMGSFSCECPLGQDIENGRDCTRAKTFLGTFSVNNPTHDSMLSRSVSLHEIQREINQLLNASLSTLRGYRQSILKEKGNDSASISAVNMFSISADVTSYDVLHNIQMSLKNCTNSAGHCRVVVTHQLSYHSTAILHLTSSVIFLQISLSFTPTSFTLISVMLIYNQQDKRHAISYLECFPYPKKPWKSEDISYFIPGHGTNILALMLSVPQMRVSVWPRTPSVTQSVPYVMTPVGQPTASVHQGTIN
ncbi:mucin-5AC isoform X2 [Esox lucius]|uniref:mucin-5AC isoform X2 n=1 Tax=Esox lucius TaxID=8010 RepID=UPI00147703E3|nr:mucin-5AC isoform X2 [Esox lucius]XP_028981691.2 mucin-5AC isoform X2 [Esox lucius]